MKKIALILIALTCSCSKNTSKNCNDTGRNIEAVSIAKTVVNYMDNDSLIRALPLCTNLNRITISSDSNNTAEHIRVEKLAQNRSLPIKKLLRTEINDQLFFKPSDSLDIISQNCTSEFILPEKEIQSRSIITKEQLESDLIPEYISISYPVFSNDNNKAYIEIGIYSKKRKFGNSLYLKKEKNRWTVAKVQPLWDI